MAHQKGIFLSLIENQCQTLEIFYYFTDQNLPFKWTKNQGRLFSEIEQQTS